jgi:hypothetical protein
MARVRVGQGMADQNYCVLCGCLLSLSLCGRGFQDLFKVRPSSLFILPRRKHITYRTRGKFEIKNLKNVFTESSEEKA